MFLGFVISVWLTIEWIGGESPLAPSTADSRRCPDRFVGVQLGAVTFGLVSEMIAAARQDVRGKQVRALQVERVIGGAMAQEPEAVHPAESE